MAPGEPTPLEKAPHTWHVALSEKAPPLFVGVQPFPSPVVAALLADRVLLVKLIPA